MKKLVIFFLLLFTINNPCIAQMPDTAGTIRPWSNTPGYDFPRLDKENRAIFRLKASNAKKVQVDLGGMNDGVMSADSFWIVITKYLGVGFHYYFLVIDGVRVADPASESYWGTGKWSSGIEVPSDDNEVALKDPSLTNKRLKLFWIGVGKDDGLYPVISDYLKVLDEKKIKHETLISDGGHTWMNCKLYLSTIAQKLFK